MHKLNIFNGGFRVKASDFTTLQNAYIEGFKAILNAFGNRYIIWGCEIVINAGNYDISEGAICVDGEYYLVPAHSVPIVVGDTYYWEILTQDLNAVTYQDTTIHHSLTERWIQLNHALTPPVGYVEKDLPLMIYLINGKWIQETNINSLFVIAGVTCTPISSSPLQANRQNRVWYRIIGDTLELSASIYVGMTSGTVTGVTSAELKFPLGLLAHTNADVFDIGAKGFTATGVESCVIELNNTGDGVYITWDTSVPVPDNLYIRIPNLKIKLQ